jgi:hypothetical protein
MHPVTARKPLFLSPHIGTIVVWQNPGGACASAPSAGASDAAAYHEQRHAFDETQVRDMGRTAMTGAVVPVS